MLRGNNDRDTTVKHVIYGVSTRYLRFLPQTQQGRVCMRTEVFGVQQERGEYDIYMAKYYHVL